MAFPAEGQGLGPQQLRKALHWTPAGTALQTEQQGQRPEVIVREALGPASALLSVGEEEPQRSWRETTVPGLAPGAGTRVRPIV